MNLVFDTSVWVQHLRKDLLTALMPRIRGRYFLWVDSVVVGELRAGCRSKAERRTVARMLSSFRGADRIVTPGRGDYERAGEAISRLRQAGRTLRNPGGGLLDALQAADARGIGALLVTLNISDFRALRSYIPLAVESFDDFRRRL